MRRTPKSQSSGTFATLFRNKGSFTGSDGRPCWRGRGSGNSGPAERGLWTGAIPVLLEKHGDAVDRSESSGFSGADSRRLSARFLDGGQCVEAGNYVGRSRGAYLYGAQAATLIALGRRLRVGQGVLDTLGIAQVTFADLCSELGTDPQVLS
jgi:hypothetical protein